MAAQFLIIAHRGNSELCPENTTEAFDRALEQGFPHFETDVQLTKGGACVVLHDEQLGRTVKAPEDAASAAVADTDWSFLQGSDAGSWKGAEWAGARIPTLQTV